MLCGRCNEGRFYTLMVTWKPQEDYTVANGYEYVVRLGETVKYEGVSFIPSDKELKANTTVSRILRITTKVKHYRITGESCLRTNYLWLRFYLLLVTIENH